MLFTWVRGCQQESLLCHGLLRVLYPLEFLSEGEGIQAPTERDRNTEIPTRRVPPRNAALDSTWESRLMLDS